MKRLLAALLALPLLVPSAHAENWPAWRGPQGTGLSTAKSAPLTWSQGENILWRTELPAEGNSTPIVWGDRVFVTGALENGAVRTLMCFDRANGKLLWTTEVAYDGKDQTHSTNPFCSASPVTDGERVIVWHGSAGVHAYDFSGKELWSVDLGRFEHIWGTAASPVLHDGKVYLNCGPGLSAFLIALDAKTGKEIWRTVPEDAVSAKPGEYRGSWSTPVFHEVAGKSRMFVSLPQMLAAYDPADGKLIWSCKGLSKLAYTSVLVGDGLVVGMSGYGGPALACRTGGEGDVTETHRLWLHEKKNPQRVGSGVIVGEHLYILNEPGIAWCLNAKTGEKLWEQRLGGKAWSSMVHAAGRLYVINMEGKTFVLEPTPTECKVLAENDLEETTRASLAFSEGQVFARTYKALYCIGEEKK